MPYVKAGARERLAATESFPLPANAGELNYVVTRLCDRMLGSDVNYSKINALIGALECAKLELYRRVAAPYEVSKSLENGDVYANGTR